MYKTTESASFASTVDADAALPFSAPGTGPVRTMSTVKNQTTDMMERFLILLFIAFPSASLCRHLISNA
jgi:hypothetical protein